MLLTDLIEKFIKDLINEEDGEVVIQRMNLQIILDVFHHR